MSCSSAGPHGSSGKAVGGGFRKHGGAETSCVTYGWPRWELHRSLAVGKCQGRGNAHPGWSASWVVDFKGMWWFKKMEEGVGRTAAHVNLPLRGGFILSRCCLGTCCCIYTLHRARRAAGLCSCRVLAWQRDAVQRVPAAPSTHHCICGSALCCRALGGTGGHPGQ